MRLASFLIFFWISVFSVAQVIPADRRVNWSDAGYKGSLPDPDLLINVLDFGALGDSLTDNTSALNDAMNYLDGQRGVIFFPAGTYLFYSSIVLSDSIIIRGASSDETHLVFDLGGSNQNCFTIARGQSLPFTSVYAGFEKSSSMILVEDPSGFQESGYAELRQTNGSWDTEPISWAAYSVGQMLQIQEISGDTLFISNPLRIDYNEDLNPEIRRLTPVREVGLECFKITRADNTVQGVGYNFYLSFAVNCWLRGIESNLSVGSHIYITQSKQIEISGCFIHDAYAYDGSGTRGYGITLNLHSSDCLIENNIFRHLRHAMMVKTGANGNIFAYNYSIEPYRSEPIHNFSGDISLHGHYAFANLFEGNIVQNIIIDHYWGPSGPYNTFFRNRTELYGIVMTSSDTTETAFQNFAGNEVTDTAFLYGNYVLSGEDHFEYGNNIKGTIIPPGTENLPDTSYYRISLPPFWDIEAAWPSIGLPNEIGEYSIPAKERYWFGWTRTSCSDTLYTGQFSGRLIENKHIYPNPTKGILNINSAESIDAIQVFDHHANLVLNISGGTNIIQLPNSLPGGIYFVRLVNSEKSTVKKIILLR